MEDNLILMIAVGVLALVVGGIASWFILKKGMKSRELAAIDRAKAIVKDAENDAEVIKKNKILEAKEKFLQLKAEHERHISEKDKTIGQAEGRIKQKEANLAQRTEQTQRKQQEYETLQTNLKNQLSILDAKKEELAKLHSRQVEQLEKISGLSVEQAKSQLVEALKAEAKTDAMSY